jgi:hypothetical protein
LAVESGGRRSEFAGGAFKMSEDTVAHLGCGCNREGDGEYLLGLGNGLVGEQLEEALDEQACLAGAGGSFDDEGAANVEGFGASGGIGRAGEGRWGFGRTG